MITTSDVRVQTKISVISNQSINQMTIFWNEFPNHLVSFTIL